MASRRGRGSDGTPRRAGWAADGWAGLVSAFARLFGAGRRAGAQGAGTADVNESHRFQGLALQGKGQLVQAFVEFRQCPLDEALMQVLYNLALAFECKHEFSSADAVWRYMAGYNPEFRDIAQRLKRGLPVASGPTSAAAPRMLGFYRLGKTLGKGAMGLVYQGQDSRNQHVVAIKTMALSQAFDATELQEVKERFLREAESAGRLKHPNIVTIIDAGEENETAYIVMEFLRGHDLLPVTKPGALLPLPQVLSIVARVADALDYAHRQNVVHRDVKPANIMYEPESDQVKVTDFGVARLTDASRTKTGMVLGTPSYMSPEQLMGQKVDGRSDIFSLGVTLYQMVCGKLPFVGESMAQLMFMITRDAHPDIRTMKANPPVPDSLVMIIDRAMSKEVNKRYQTGAEMAVDVRACRMQLEAPRAEIDIQL